MHQECLTRGWVWSIQEQAAVPLQWLQVVNILQHLPEKVVPTTAEPCSKTLDMCLLPQFKSNPLYR